MRSHRSLWGEPSAPSACSTGPATESHGRRGAMLSGESVPVLVASDGYARRLANIDPNFNSSQAMRAFAKSAGRSISRPGRQHLPACIYESSTGGRPGIVESPLICERGSAGASRLHPGAAHPLRRSPPMSRSGGAVIGPSGPSTTPARACIITGLAAVRGGWRQRTGHPRHYESRRQVVVPETHPLSLARAGSPCRGSAEIPQRGRLDFRHRLLVHGNVFRHRHAERQDHHPSTLIRRI